MISMSIALTIAAILSLASAKYAINKFNEDKGTLVGNQLQTVVNALNTYITDNAVEISNPLATVKVADVKNKRNPTIAELKIKKYLGVDFNTTPIMGGSYITNIDVEVPPCSYNCLIGSVYLTNPIGVTNNNAVDIRLLGAALSASKTGQIGFSTPATPLFISGPGWQVNNPDTNANKRAGILYGTTSLLASLQKNWLAPATREGTLPMIDNIVGDVRMTIDTVKPNMWNGTKWVEAFSNPNTNSLSIGTYSGSTKSTTPNPIDTKNTFIGYEAGRFINDGSYNVFLGPFSGANAGNGSNNIFIGPYSGRLNKPFSPSSTLPDYNIFMGLNSGKKNNGHSNIFIGPNSGENNTTGKENIFIGYKSGTSNTAGFGNTFLGKESGNLNTASFNTFMGFQAGIANTIGNNNLFSGSSSGFKNATGSENTFNGFKSGHDNESGNNNVYTGFYSGYSLNGNNNTAIGHKSGYNPSITANPISNITAIGSSAYTEAESATAIGSNSIAKSAKSTSIGSSSFALATNSVAIGAKAQVSSSLATNSMAIGYESSVGSPNTVRIGNDSLEWVNIGKANLATTGDISAKNITATTVTATSVNSSSDKRLKDHITDAPRDLSFIKKLRPVDYTLISNGQPQTGFIAQEVESADPAFPGIVKPQNDRDFYALTYTAFIPAIVKSIQQLDARLDKLAPAPSTTAPASVSGLADGAAPAPASADVSLLKWLVLFLSVCVLSCLAVIVRFYKELQAMRLSVQRLHALAA